MEYRTLSTTDLKVSRLCFGTMTFGSQTDEAAASRIVDRCIDAGINFFDTANFYNHGAAETILAKALAGKRQKVILATKVGLKMGDGPMRAGFHAPPFTKLWRQASSGCKPTMWTSTTSTCRITPCRLKKRSPPWMR